MFPPVSGHLGTISCILAVGVFAPVSGRLLLVLSITLFTTLSSTTVVGSGLILRYVAECHC